MPREDNYSNDNENNSNHLSVPGTVQKYFMAIKIALPFKFLNDFGTETSLSLVCQMSKLRPREMVLLLEVT